MFGKRFGRKDFFGFLPALHVSVANDERKTKTLGDGTHQSWSFRRVIAKSCHARHHEAGNPGQALGIALARRLGRAARMIEGRQRQAIDKASDEIERSWRRQSLGIDPVVEIADAPAAGRQALELRRALPRKTDQKP